MANRLTNKTVALPARGEREQRLCASRTDVISSAPKKMAGSKPGHLHLIVIVFRECYGAACAFAAAMSASLRNDITVTLRVR
jgi:hypothetical protein